MPCVCGKDVTCLDEYLKEFNWIVSPVKFLEEGVPPRDKIIWVDYDCNDVLEDPAGIIERYFLCKECGERYDTEEDVIKQFGGDI